MRTTNPAQRGAWSRRPDFRPRQILTAEQLNAGFRDQLDRQRLLNRAVHGYGVVLGFGLVVDDSGAPAVSDGCIEVTGGLALDRHGRMLSWQGGSIGFSDLVGEIPEEAGRYTLSAHFAARPPSSAGCDPCGEQPQWREEAVVFTLRRGCVRADRSCPAHPEGACIGHGEYLCRRTGALPRRDLPRRDLPGPDVDPVHAAPAELCDLGFGGWQYDPDPEVGVPLADVVICDVAAPNCDPSWGFGAEPARVCTVRPLVYRNPLLYELTQGCDVRLPRVQKISWRDGTELGQDEIEWTVFAARMRKGLTIRFTRPIQLATIHDASIFVTALVRDTGNGYRESVRVPVGIVVAQPNDVAQPNETALGVHVVPDQAWLTDEVKTEVKDGRFTRLSGARFEVTIRGQLLRDGCGRMLDARPLDIDDGERGHERPGGDLVSTFRVAST